MAALSPRIAPPGDSDTRAVFVIDGIDRLAAAVDLQQAADHLRVEWLAVAPGENDGERARSLLGFAEIVAEGIGLTELRLQPDAVPREIAASLGYVDSRKRLGRSWLRRALRHLEDSGVPLWRDGWASLSQTLYLRGAWACIALVLGLGSIPLAVFSASDVTWLHFIAPAVLSVGGVLFALWQIVLVMQAARRSGRQSAFIATLMAAAVSFVAIAALLQERALPALAELWEIRTGDTRLSNLDVAISGDGLTLHVDGSYGINAATDVRQALARHPGIREIILSGPGGRAGPAFEMFDMFRHRRLATRVEAECYSACTIAFLGGVRRSVSPDGRLGFHRSSFPGMSESDMHESNRNDRRFLLYGARLAPGFVEKVMQTPPESIWRPTPQELLEGRVIDGVGP